MTDKQVDFLHQKIEELCNRFGKRILILNNIESESRILYKMKTDLPGLVHHLDIEMVCWQMANSHTGKLIICEEVSWEESFTELE